jgi:hypothetical protein
LVSARAGRFGVGSARSSSWPAEHTDGSRRPIRRIDHLELALADPALTLIGDIRRLQTRDREQVTAELLGLVDIRHHVPSRVSLPRTRPPRWPRSTPPAPPHGPERGSWPVIMPRIAGDSLMLSGMGRQPLNRQHVVLRTGVDSGPRLCATFGTAPARRSHRVIILSRAETRDRCVHG